MEHQDAEIVAATVERAMRKIVRYAMHIAPEWFWPTWIGSLPPALDLEEKFKIPFKGKAALLVIGAREMFLTHADEAKYGRGIMATLYTEGHPTQPLMTDVGDFTAVVVDQIGNRRGKPVVYRPIKYVEVTPEEDLAAQGLLRRKAQLGRNPAPARE